MSKLDVEKICRLCCEKKSRMRSLFEQRREYPLSLPQIVFDVSRLQVDSDDGMPQKVCSWCVTTLLKMFQTIEMYRASDLKLRSQLVGTLQIEIKQEEEEMDIGMLDKAFTQDLVVGDLCVKPEAMEEEYLDPDLLDESELPDKTDETDVSTTRALADDVDHKDEPSPDNDEDDVEWKPTEQDTEDKEPPVKKYRRKTKQEKLAKGKRRMGRPRTKVEDPNRPRKRDNKCYICKSGSHGTSEALLVHLTSVHEAQLPFTCPECVMDTVVIRTVQKMNAHIRQHLNPEKCPYCDKRYTNKNNVAIHVATYHQDGDVQCSATCEVCGEVCPSKAALLHHMKVHTTAASCEFCGKIFKERYKLRLHIQRRHEKVKQYECHICKKKLGSLDSVQLHIKAYHSNLEFKCRYCSMVHTSELKHQNHEKKHVENPDYVSKKYWKEHYTIIEGAPQNKPGCAKMKKCNICGVVTKAMGTHLSMVHFPSEYRCTICDMTYKHKQRFEIHVREHESGKAHQCPICGREFSDRKNLIAHLRTKQHRDHPLAKSWLASTASKPMPSKPKATDCDEAQEQDIIVEDYELGDSP